MCGDEGKEQSQCSPMQVKVINMGTWCLGVKLGHLALGGDKYGGLNLHVGGWETG